MIDLDSLAEARAQSLKQDTASWKQAAWTPAFQRVSQNLSDGEIDMFFDSCQSVQEFSVLTGLMNESLQVGGISFGEILAEVARSGYQLQEWVQALVVVKRWLNANERDANLFEIVKLVGQCAREAAKQMGSLTGAVELWLNKNSFGKLMDDFDFATMMDFLRSWNIHRQVLSSAVLFVSFLLFRWTMIATIRRWNAPSADEKRRWIVQIKNASLVILAAGLLGIWATELRTFALSLVAVAAALAISTKEIIQCFLGGFYKASVGPFDLGDRIEVHGYRGEVIDHNFLSTTLLEIGPAPESNSLSGRQLVLPNSLYLSNPIMNQSIQQAYALHTIRLVLHPHEDWRSMEKMLLEVAMAQCSGILESARHSMQRRGQKEGLDLPTVDPRVSFQFLEDGRTQAILRFPVQASRISRTEQAVTRAILERRPPPTPQETEFNRPTL